VTYQAIHHSSCLSHTIYLPIFCNFNYQCIYRSRSLSRYCS